MLKLSRPLCGAPIHDLASPSRPAHSTRPCSPASPPARCALAIAASARAGIEASVRAVRELVSRHEPVYGINTGFGKLAQTRIADDQLTQLQKNLVLSHSAGVGAPLSAPVVRLMLLLKAASLAHGVSGVRLEVIEALLALLAHDVLPVVPEKGSVGASGDLAPLAHLAGVLIGVGEAFVGGQRLPALEALPHAGLKPLPARPEGGPGAAQRHAGLDRAGDPRRAAPGARVRRRAGRRRDDGRRRQGLGHALRRPHPRGARPARPARGGGALPRLAGRQPAARLAPRLREGAGPVLPALPAAGDGRLPRPDDPCLGHPADRGERRVGQPAGLRRHDGGAVRRQLPRRAGGLRGRQPGAGHRRDRRAVGAPHGDADGPGACPTCRPSWSSTAGSTPAS